MKKRGRPTDNPKTLQVNVRLDEECVEILTKYMDEHNVTRVEAIRRGIKKLSEDVGE